MKGRSAPSYVTFLRISLSMSSSLIIGLQTEGHFASLVIPSSQSHLHASPCLHLIVAYAIVFFSGHLPPSDSALSLHFPKHVTSSGERYAVRTRWQMPMEYAGLSVCAADISFPPGIHHESTGTLNTFSSR
ncbi:hypothetical protein C8Q74DRAFT_919123 [Fomes fomentarius]|nr:hypothetical protein C8Q74DRAFT_919123 [Fomes fomentarius]